MALWPRRGYAWPGPSVFPGSSPPARSVTWNLALQIGNSNKDAVSQTQEGQTGKETSSQRGAAVVPVLSCSLIRPLISSSWWRSEVSRSGMRSPILDCSLAMAAALEVRQQLVHGVRPSLPGGLQGPHPPIRSPGTYRQQQEPEPVRARWFPSSLQITTLLPSQWNFGSFHILLRKQCWILKFLVFIISPFMLVMINTEASSPSPGPREQPTPTFPGLMTPALHLFPQQR